MTPPIDQCVRSSRGVEHGPGIAFRTDFIYDEESRLVMAETDDGRGLTTKAVWTYDHVGNLLDLVLDRGDQGRSRAEYSYDCW